MLWWWLKLYLSCSLWILSTSQESWSTAPTRAVQLGCKVPALLTQGVPVPPQTGVGQPPLPTALPYPRDLLHVPSPTYFDPGAQSRNARRLFAPSWIEKHPTDLSFFFFLIMLRDFFLIGSSAHEGPAAYPTSAAPWPRHRLRWRSPQAWVNFFASRQTS